MESKSENKIQFLAGGGEMGMLTRQKDWSKTPLGPPLYWPQSLRTALSILLNSKFPMFLWWGEDLICFYNDAYRPSLGKNGKHPSILGMKAVDAWPEIWHIIKPLIDQVLAGGEATWSEDQLIPIYRNGKIEDVYWTFSYSPVNDESGKPAGVYVTCSETTEKVLVYKKLEESKNLLEFAIAAAALGTFDYNPLTNKFSSNDRLKQWFGLTTDEDVDFYHALNAVHENDRKRVTDAVTRALDYDSGGLYDIEYTIVHPETKKETIVHAKGKAWFDNKIAYRFNGTLDDVTEQTTARRKIEQTVSELQVFKFVMDNITDFIGICDMDLIPFYVNKEGLEAVGLDSLEQFKELKVQDFFFPEDLDFIMNDFYPMVFKNGRNECEIRFKHFKTGEGMWMIYNVVLVKDSKGNSIGYATVSKNITQQKTFAAQLESQVRTRTKELAQKNVELEKMNKELQSFAYISSHDLQEPLRKIQTFATFLLEKEVDNLTETGKGMFRRMEEAAARMQTLIDDLLAYSRTNSAERQYEETDLNLIVNEVRADMQEELQQKKAVIKTGDLNKIKIIPFQFRQLLNNLVSNSLKFSSPAALPVIIINSKIAKGAEFTYANLLKDKKYCYISISDNGIGFEQQYNEKIFEVFQRLHGKSEYGGTGIGLAIVKKIIENHNGIITAKGELNKGAQFEIYIPVN